MANGIFGVKPRVIRIDFGDTSVYVREISAKERVDLRGKLKDGSPLPFEELAIVALCDLEGYRVFNQVDDSSLSVIGGIPASALDKIVEAWLDLNGMSAKAAEEKTKNS